MGSRIREMGSAFELNWVVTAKFALLPFPPECVYGFIRLTYHEIAGLLSLLVLFVTSKTVDAIFEEEAPTPPPSTATPDFWRIW